MSNTKRDEYTLFNGSTPYFNEHEFSQKLSKCEKDYSKVPFFLIILKGTNYNKITSQQIEFYLLRHSWGVGMPNAEYFLIKGINFESRLKPAKAKSKSKTKKKELTRMKSLKMGIVQSYYQKFLNLFIKLEMNRK